MVIEIDDKRLEQILSQFSYNDLKKIVKEALLEKVENLRDYNMLKESRKDEKVDFEEFLKNEDKYQKKGYKRFKIY